MEEMATLSKNAASGCHPQSKPDTRLLLISVCFFPTWCPYQQDIPAPAARPWHTCRASVIRSAWFAGSGGKPQKAVSQPQASPLLLHARTDTRRAQESFLAPSEYRGTHPP